MPGGDFKDADGNVWDAVGPLPSDAFDQPNRLNGFFRSIVDGHVDVPEKGNIIVDLAGLPPSLKKRALETVSSRTNGAGEVRVNAEIALDNNKTIIFLDD